MVATKPDPFLGRTLGQVKLSTRLGAGAMGVVYRGWHERLEREVAVKLLVSNRNDKPTYRERFLREGRAAAKVRHDHVVAVLDAGQDGDVAFLVMELVNGMSLGDILDEAKMLAPDVVVQLGVGMALGLAAIHDKDIVHRDIKPDNILVGSDKKARIADLGLAKQLNDPELQRLTATGVVVGTPLYVSPEGIRDPTTISDRSDVYSLGATFYHMLTGRPPFQGATPYEVMHGHLQAKVTPIRTLRPEIPEYLAHLVEHCLSKDQHRRPSAMELADLLMQGNAQRPSGRKGGLVLTIAVVLAVAGAGTWQFLRPQAITEEHTDAPIPAALAATLDLGDIDPQAEVFIDGKRVNVSNGTLTLAAGSHRVRIDVNASGPLRRAATTLTMTAGTTTPWRPQLVTVPITETRITIPHQGMLFANGSAYGLDPVFVTALAGTYHLARWDGRLWNAATISIADDGQHPEPAWTSTDKPAASAFWRDQIDTLKVPRHHLVSWWMAEQARAQAALPVVVGWTSQGSQPEQPASNVPPDLVSVVADLARPWGAQLPDRATAMTLARHLGSSLWCRDQSALARVGGLGGSPMLVLVPAP